MRCVVTSLIIGCCPLAACSDDAPKPPSQCRSQCELAGSCPARAFEDYPDYDATLTEWGLPDSCDGLVFAHAGTCADDKRFLQVGNGTTSELRYFDASGQFLGLTTATDVAAEPCWGHSFWPDAIVCKGATVRIVYCGNVWSEGEAIDVPYADGIHP